MAVPGQSLECAQCLATAPHPAPSPLSYIQGILRGFDQATNIILDECHERVFSTKLPVEQLVLGLYVIRGDNM